MPNDNGIDVAELGMMSALLRFKKQHGNAAYLALLAKFNVQRWSEIPATAHGAVTLRCAAGVAGLKIEAAGHGEDDTTTIQDRLSEIATKLYGKPKSTDDFKTVVNGAPDLKTGFSRAARAIHARNK